MYQNNRTSWHESLSVDAPEEVDVFYATDANSVYVIWALGTSALSSKCCIPESFRSEAQGSNPHVLI